MILLAVILSCLLSSVLGDYEDKSILCDGINEICLLADSEYYEDPQAECDSKASKGEVWQAFPNSMICNCGSRCLRYQEEGEPCGINYVWNYPEEMCGPMLACFPLDGSTSEYTCQKDRTKKCVKEVIDYEEEQSHGVLGPARQRLNCDVDGTYAGKQCSPGTTCYCVDEENERLFGEEIISKSENMTCECARNWKKTQDKNLNLGMKCSPNGNFDSLQCLGEICYCFDPVKLVLEEGPLHISMITQMSCYNPDYHSSDYLNPCERRVKEIEGKLTENMEIIDDKLPTCSADGYYAAVQQNGLEVMCVDIYGNQIENFKTTILEDDEANCNCARRRNFMMNSGVTGKLPKCLENGNYDPKQVSGLFTYCVDSNGNQVGKSYAIMENFNC